MEESAFVKVFGSSPMVKLLDFFLAERGLYDYTLTEIAENSGVSWTTLHRIFPKLLKLEIVKETRKISRGKLYAINEDSQLVKTLVKMRNEISDCFIQKELEKQGLENKKIVVRV
jgi:DNA-binding transcriptional ArsR family regulator